MSRASYTLNIGSSRPPRMFRTPSPESSTRYFGRSVASRYSLLSNEPIQRRRSGARRSFQVSTKLEPVNYSKEIRVALDYLQRSTKPTSRVLKRQFTMFSPKKRLMHPAEGEVNSFIRAIFVHEPSPYRKTIISSTEETVDARTADKLLHEANKIIRHGLKKKDKESGLRTEIEYFWHTHISNEDTVRWDLFEESLLLFLDCYMVTDLGYIRKVNWKRFLRKLCKAAAQFYHQVTLWPPSPSCESPPVYSGGVISKHDFSALIQRGSLTEVFCNALQDIPCYLKILKQQPEYTFGDGTVYKGKWLGGKKDGIGTMHYPSGEVFKGNFTRGLREDYGVFEGNSYLYKGDFRKDLFSGYGTMQFPGKAVYEGAWSKGEMTNGKFTWDGRCYQGEWRQFKFEGPGILTFPNGELHKGYWKQGTLFGQSRITKPDGTVFKGLYIDGFLEGKGAMITPELRYKGEFKHSKPHGLGKFIWPNGESYKGECVEGLPHGQGRFRSQGQEYTGELVKGERTGTGTIVYADGTEYTGPVTKGLPCGKGKVQFPEGHKLEVYTGQLRDGLFHGHGRLVYRNGFSYEGDWAHGKFAGKGLLKAGPETYKGEFSEGLYNGYGEWNHGLAFYSGLWEMGVPEGRGDCKDWEGEAFAGVFVKGAPVVRTKLQPTFLELVQSRVSDLTSLVVNLPL